MKNIFQSCSTLEFTAKNIFTIRDKQCSIIEFSLILDGNIPLQGVDIIEWDPHTGLMRDLRAYLI